jgi:hypothetical protein
LVNAGATRLGCSAGVAIAKGEAAISDSNLLLSEINFKSRVVF